MSEDDRSYEELHARLNALEERVHVLEQTAGVESPLPHRAATKRDEPAAKAPDASTLLGAAGRAFLVLGGAFLIRALAQGGTLSNPVGVALGAAYVVVWVVLAERAARRRSDRLSAVAYGLSATLVGAPLVWEASSRFAVVSPAVGAFALVLLVVALLALATLHRLRLLAWIAVAAGAATPLALLSSTHDFIASSTALVACGLAAAVAALLGPAARLPRWPAAAIADLLVFFGIFLVSRPGGPPPTYTSLGALPMLLIGLALSLAYLGAFTWAALVRRRDAGAFELLQGSAASALGLLAVERLGPPSGLSSGALGAALLVVGLAVFAASFTLLDRAPELRRSFLFCAWQAWAFVLFASWTLLPAALRGVAWSVLAVLGAVLATRFERFTLALQAALSAVVAAVAAGAPQAVADALVASAPVAGRALALPVAVSIVAAGVTHRLLRAFSSHASPPRRIAAWIPGAVWIVGGTALLAALLTTLLSAAGDPPRLALARSLALSIAAVAVGLVARFRTFGELPVAPIALLVATALQLVAETVPSGNALVVFLGFGAFGGALLVAARLRRRSP